MTTARKIELTIGLDEELSVLSRDDEFDLDDAIERNNWKICGDKNILTTILREDCSAVQDFKFKVIEITEQIQKIDSLDKVTDRDMHKREKLLEALGLLVGKDNCHNWFTMSREEHWQIVQDIMEVEHHKRYRIKYRGKYVSVDNEGNVSKQEWNVKRTQMIHINSIKKNREMFTYISEDKTRGELYAEAANEEDYLEILEVESYLHRTRLNKIILRLNETNGGDGSKGGDGDSKSLVKINPLSKEEKIGLLDINKKFRNIYY